MNYRFVSFRSAALIILLSGFLITTSSCSVYHPRYRVHHDSGLHKGWYKNPGKPEKHYLKPQQGPKPKKSKQNKH